MKNSLIVCILVLFPTILFAEGLQIKPGMWEITSTSENSMMGGARTRTTKKCMAESEFDPISQMEGIDKEQCKTTTKVNGNKMDYTIECNLPDSGNYTGKGTFISHGDTMDSVMDMQGTAEGHTIAMKISAKGKRVGDC